MCCALNRPAEAVTASRIEARPITPLAPQALERLAMRQTWRRLTFLHWPYEPAAVRRLLPPGLELDTFDGAAYVGLIPFEIYNLPGLPHFPETNVRTYVIGPDGSRAVWFFSLDAGRLLAVIGARVGYHLPYFWANMQVTRQNGTIHYRSRRRWPHSKLRFTDLAVEPGGVKELTELDHFLTARYRLYTVTRGRLGYAQIQHNPWPLAHATVLQLNQNLIEASGLSTPQGAPLVHYSADLDVEIRYLRGLNP
jgi:uncharacterized protein YqjF (DUF2071 family)